MDNSLSGMHLKEQKQSNIKQDFPRQAPWAFYQGFLRLNDIGLIGGQQNLHLRIIGGHRETLKAHAIHLLKNKS